MEIAALGLKIEGVKDAERAAKAVDGLAASSTKAEKATGNLSGETNKGKKSLSDFSRESGKATGGMTSFASAARSALGPLGSIGAATAALRSTINTVSGFESSMSKVGAISRASASELDLLRETALQMGAETVFSASQAADGLSFLSQAGFTARESAAALGDVLNLAAASGMDLATTADIASNVMSGFGIAATDAAQAADILAAISSRANTNVAQLGEAASYVGPVAEAMGVSLGDASAAIGVLSDAGIQGSSAGTGLRRVLSSLANPTKAAEQALTGLGVTLADVNPETNDLADIIDTLAKTGMSASEAMTIFGDRGGPAILALTANNDRVRELTQEMQNVSGEAQRMADVLTDNLAGDMKSLGSAVEALQLQLGTGGLDGVMRETVQTGTELVRAVTNISNALSGLSDSAKSSGSALVNTLQSAIKTVHPMYGSFERLLGIANSTADGINWVADALKDSGNEARKAQAPLRSAQQSAGNLGDAAGNAAKLLEEMGVLTADLGDEAKGLVPPMRAAAKEVAEVGRVAGLTEEELTDLRSSVQKITDKLFPAEARFREYSQTVDTLKLALKEGEISQDRFSEAVSRAGAELLSTHEPLEYTETQLLSLGDAAKEAADEAEPMATAYKRGIERMRDGFGDFFKNILTDGKLSFDRLVDLFKNTVAEMIATASANSILVGVGAMTASQAATAGGTLSSLMPSGGGLSGITSMLGGSISGLYETIGTGLSNLGMTGLGDAAYNAGLAHAGLGGAALGIGGGLAGGFLGNKAFGSTSGIGSSLGAIAGGMLPIPIPGVGSAIGSFLGSGIESLFGGTQRADKTGQAINFATGAVTRGASRGHGMDEAADAVTQQLFAAAQAIGGSAAQFEVRSHGKRGLGIVTGRGRADNYGDDFDAFFADAFDRIVSGADHLDASLRRVIQSFEGTAEETTRYASSMVSLSDAVRENPVTVAVRDFKTAQDAAAGGLFGAYQRQIEEIKSLTSAYDGSAGMTARLADAMGASQQAAYQLAQGLSNLKVQMGEMFAESAKSIRQSVLSEQELFEVRKQERDELRRSIGSIVDPENLQRTLAEINALNNQLFQSIGDPSKEQAEVFARYAEETAAAGERRADALLDKLQDTQQSQMDRVDAIMQSAAAQQQQAAQEFGKHVGSFGNVLSQMQAIVNNASGSASQAQAVIAALRNRGEGSEVVI